MSISYWPVVLSFQKNRPQNVVVQQQYNILLLYSFQLKELGCRKVHADLAVLSYYNEGWEELSNISAAYNRPPTTRACRLQCTYYRPYIGLADWLAVLYAISRTTSFLRSGDSKKMGTKVGSIAVSPCCSSSAAAHYHTVVPNVKNPPKHNFALGVFTSFSMEVFGNSRNFRFRVPEIHIQNLSNRCRQAQV